MAKNDYHVVMYRILAYLYACLKEEAEFNPDEVGFDTLGIPESYWTSIMTNMIEKGYIKGAIIVPV